MTTHGYLPINQLRLRWLWNQIKTSIYNGRAYFRMIFLTLGEHMKFAISCVFAPVFLFPLLLQFYVCEIEVDRHVLTTCLLSMFAYNCFIGERENRYTHTHTQTHISSTYNESIQIESEIIHTPKLKISCPSENILHLVRSHLQLGIIYWVWIQG